MWEATLAQVPDTVKISLPTTAFECFAKENLANARRHIAAAGKVNSMDVLIRRELESGWEVMIKKVPASVRCALGSNAFENFVTKEWTTVAKRLEMQAKTDTEASVFVPKIDVRLEMQAKTDAEASAFVPKIDVKCGASDASVVEIRRQLLLHMDTQKNEMLEAYLQEQWAYSVENLPAEVAVLVPTMPSQQFYEEHYYEYMMKLFGRESASINCKEPPSLGVQNTNSVVGMRGILKKRPLVKGNEVTYGSVKVCNCHDLLSERPGTGLQWSLTCTVHLIICISIA